MNLKYILFEFVEGVKEGFNINKQKLFMFTLLSILMQNNYVFAQEEGGGGSGLTSGLMTKVINWCLFFGGVITAFYISKDIKPVLEGSKSIWKLLGLALSAFIVLGIIAVLVNFESIANAFKSPIDSLSNKAAEELGGAVGGTP